MLAIHSLKFEGLRIEVYAFAWASIIVFEKESIRLGYGKKICDFTGDQLFLIGRGSMVICFSYVED